MSGNTMSPRITLNPTVIDEIRLKLGGIVVKDLSKDFRERLIDNILRGLSTFTVMYEVPNSALQKQWFHALEDESFDMSNELKDLVFFMTGLPFLAGCRAMRFLDIRSREITGLMPIFLHKKGRWNRSKAQYEFLNRAWPLAARIFVSYQK